MGEHTRGPRLIANNLRDFQGLTRALLSAAATPSDQLSAIERRLLRITIEHFLTHTTILVRVAVNPAPGEPMALAPLTPELYAKAAAMAFAAAIEVEGSLRKIRDEMGDSESGA